MSQRQIQREREKERESESETERLRERERETNIQGPSDLLQVRHITWVNGSSGLKELQ